MRAAGFFAQRTKRARQTRRKLKTLDGECLRAVGSSRAVKRKGHPRDFAGQLALPVLAMIEAVFGGVAGTGGINQPAGRISVRRVLESWRQVAVLGCAAFPAQEIIPFGPKTVNIAG